MIIIDIIEDAISQLPNSFTFLYADSFEQNLQGDIAFPVAFLMPIKSNDTLTMTVVNPSYDIAIYLGAKSEPDWTLKQHTSNCVDAMWEASIKLILKLQRDSRVKKIEGGTRQVIINKDDVNTSGVWMELKIITIEQASICT